MTTCEKIHTYVFVYVWASIFSTKAMLLEFSPKYLAFWCSPNEADSLATLSFGADRLIFVHIFVMEVYAYKNVSQHRIKDMEAT